MASVYSVSQVNSYIKNMFAQDFALSRISVRGEVSNCKYHTSGHIYFTLKDGKGTLAAVMFASQRRGLSFQMAEGQQVVVTGAVDVYERDPAVIKREDTPFEERDMPGEAGAYIAGKVALERELPKICGAREIPYTVFRPAILYGPYNYAPRESAYIGMLLQNHALPRLTDAQGQFQCVYVKDAVQAVLACLGNERTYGQAYNLCQDEIITYGMFFETLKRVAEPADLEGLAEVPLTVEQAAAQGVPVPFPATAAETHLCDNTKGKAELGLSYLDFEEGMRRTYKAFRSVYVQ